VTRLAAAIALLLAIALQSPVAAHVGSPDVFLEGQAGAYRLLVTVRPPKAIPGIADVDVMTTSDDVRDVTIVPLPLAGAGAKFAPVPDRAVRSAEDPHLFTGHLWLMSAGAWQVRVTVNGDHGDGTLSVPVPTLPQNTLAMSRALGVTIAIFALLLGAGFVAIVSAMAREAKLGAGETLDPRARRRGRIAAAVTTVFVLGVGFLMNMWWTTEATAYDRYVYKPLAATTTVSDAALTLDLHDPGWISSRRIDDFIPDHGHLLHLFIVSPDLNTLWHLHPDQSHAGSFSMRPPALAAGAYELFGDVVHATGVPETVTGRIDTGAIAGAELAGDDSSWSAGDSSPTKIEWVRDNAPLVPRKLTTFAFRVLDETGAPARDLELYMGMPGHAIFVRRDRKVFAHVHPSGSAPMVLLDFAASGADDHSRHQAGTPSMVTFPYGFPEAGDYRIFVQVKRAGRIVTGAFDATVTDRAK
jgi:hypothetical protein